ncbi:MAG TPA: CoA-binding protein [Prolixibacteraceae bacterium]|jgi:predicted CoA-binding protein
MKAIIEKFVGDRNIALIGVSANKQKFGNFLLHELTKKGYTVFPVHPNLADVESIKCYPDVKSLPCHVTNLILVVNPQAAEQIIPQLKDSPIQRVWMHKGAGKGSASVASIDACKENGIELVHGFCPMMFFSPSGMHSFHFWLRRKFGKVPAEFAV